MKHWETIKPDFYSIIFLNVVVTKTVENCLLFTFNKDPFILYNTTAADDLAMQGARASSQCPPGLPYTNMV